VQDRHSRDEHEEQVEQRPLRDPRRVGDIDAARVKEPPPRRQD
jgi:hypothetical protein